MTRQLVMPELKTDRLLLRAISRDDAPSIFDYAKDPDVSKTVTWQAHKSIDDTLQFIENYVLKNYANGVPDSFAIAFKEEPQRVIGTVGFFNRSVPHCMEMGYVLGRDHWGRGLVTEAAATAIDWLFDAFPIQRLQAHCLAENRASSRVMEKLGMHFEGCWRGALRHRDYIRDVHWYSLLRSDRF